MRAPLQVRDGSLELFYALGNVADAGTDFGDLLGGARSANCGFANCASSLAASLVSFSFSFASRCRSWAKSIKPSSGIATSAPPTSTARAEARGALSCSLMPIREARASG